MQKGACVGDTEGEGVCVREKETVMLPEAEKELETE